MSTKTPEELAAEKKALEEKKEKEIKDKEEAEEKKIEAMAGDKEVIKSLLETKRKANAEAKELRLELQTIKEKQATVDDDSLKEQKKFEELADKKDTELKEAVVKFKKQAKLAALKIEAVKQSIKDPDDVRLIDLENVEIDDAYNVKNAKEIVEEFKENKAHLFKDDEEEEEEDESTLSGDKTPDLRSKIKGAKNREESPHTRATRFFSREKKKK